LASGQSGHFNHAPIASNLPQEADIFGVRREVSKVPLTEVANPYARGMAS
jgi:hypothetical protein